MKTLTNIISMLLIACSSAIAASGAGTEGNGLLVTLFLGFGALIIAFQLVPGMVLFGSMLKGIFSKSTTATSMAKRSNSGESA